MPRKKEHTIRNPPPPEERSTSMLVALQRTCNGCEQGKQPELFSDFEARVESGDLEADAPEVCNECLRYGVPSADPLRHMSAAKRRGMLVLAQGGSIREAARVAGLHNSTINKALNGREKSLFREAFRQILIHEGLGPANIAKTLADTLEAVKYQWNPAEKCWDEFPDNSARLNAMKYAAKLLDLEETPFSAKIQDSGGGVHITIETNIGDGKTLATAPNEYEIRSREDSIDAEVIG